MLIPWHFGPGSQYILILQHFLPFSNIYPLPYPLRELLALASPLPAALVGGCGVAKGQRSREKNSKKFTGTTSARFQPSSPSTVVPGNREQTCTGR